MIPLQMLLSTRNIAQIIFEINSAANAFMRNPEKEEKIWAENLHKNAEPDVEYAVTECKLQGKSKLVARSRQGRDDPGRGRAQVRAHLHHHVDYDISER